MVRNFFIYMFLWVGSIVGWELNAQDQSFLKGSYLQSEVDHDGTDLALYSFKRKKNSKGMVKAKYFAQNAYQQFSAWNQGKKILFYCSGAFSETWDPDSPPLGICVDNGQIVNRNLEESMDGLVIVYNGGKQAGGIAVVNIEKDPVNVSQGGKASYELPNPEDRLRFLRWASSQSATVFQTQLMYTQKYGDGFLLEQIRYGKRAKRRFLAICTKDGIVYHIVVDHPKSDYLNRSSKRVQQYLSEQLSYQVVGLFNLDTGGKDVMKAFDDEGNELANGTTHIKEATNLLVYYVD